MVMVQAAKAKSLKHSTWPNSGTFHACLYAKTTGMEWAPPPSIAHLTQSISPVETRSLVFKQIIWILLLLHRQSSMPVNGRSRAKAHFSFDFVTYHYGAT